MNRTSGKRIWAASLVPMVAIGLLSGCSESLQKSGAAVLAINPDPLVFSAVPVGTSDLRTVLLSNDANETDGAPLIIRDYQVNGPNGVFVVQGLEELPLTLLPGEQYTIGVQYTPVDTAAATGTIEFTSNSSDEGDEVLELSTQALGGRLFAIPNPLDFGRVPAGESVCQDVTIQNIGTSSVDVTNWTLVSPSGEFTVASFDQTVTLATAGLEGDRATVEVCYTPQTDGFDRATLIFTSTAGENGGELRVPVQANGAAPCISVNHEGSFNFGPSLLNQPNEELFIITNCSDPDNGDDLIVDGIAFTDEGGFVSSPAFALPAASLPQIPTTLTPGQTATFVVAYTPTVLDQTDRAMLRIGSNDEYKNPLDIEITGIGSNNECPTAVARCYVQGTSTPPSDELAVIPLDTLVCTAEGSIDPDGEIVEYLWEVVSQPAGSTTTFDAPGSDETTLFVDLAGRFEFRLTTVDNAGCASPAPATVIVTSTPNEDMHVQLVWETPSDPNQTDSYGADVDLHLLHPNGCWEESLWDTHFRSVNPNWGNAGASDDDPSLDIDDVDGAGPENINLDNPEAGVTYRVGVHYWSDHDYGASDVTVRIYLNGALAFERTKDGLTDGQFWDVCAVSWPSGAIAVIDRIYGTIDAAPCAP